jgi:hypothetical protein
MTDRTEYCQAQFLPMDRLPTEILPLVANLLPLDALREFRLISSRLTGVAYPVLT